MTYCDNRRGAEARRNAEQKKNTMAKKHHTLDLRIASVVARLSSAHLCASAPVRFKA